MLLQLIFQVWVKQIRNLFNLKLQMSVLAQPLARSNLALGTSPDHWESKNWSILCFRSFSLEPILFRRSNLELSVLFSTYYLTSGASPWTLLLEGPQLCSRPEGYAIVDQPYLWVVRTSYRVDECNSNLPFNSVGISLKKVLVIGISFKLFFELTGFVISGRSKVQLLGGMNTLSFEQN